MDRVRVGADPEDQGLDLHQTTRTRPIPDLRQTRAKPGLGSDVIQVARKTVEHIWARRMQDVFDSAPLSAPAVTGTLCALRSIYHV